MLLVYYPVPVLLFPKLPRRLAHAFPTLQPRLQLGMVFLHRVNRRCSKISDIG